MQIKKLLLAIVTALTILMIPQKISALDDGAYLIGRSTSYVNPLTGSTEDGGTNIALGDSMIGNIVENQLLLEQVNGKYYITIGLGLASNISNVRFKIMNSSGNFSNVNATKTGSSSANGDTVNHYRIQVSSLNVYISPIMYVTPMGRDVQFFIKPNASSATVGTGVYNSQMIPSNSQNSEQTNSTSASSNSNSNKSTDSQANSNNDSQNEQDVNTNHTTVGTLTAESLMENATGLSSYVIDENGKVDQKKKLTVKNLKNANSHVSSTDNQSNFPLIIGGVIVAVVIVIAGGFFYVKKIKK